MSTLQFTLLYFVSYEFFFSLVVAIDLYFAVGWTSLYIYYSNLLYKQENMLEETNWLVQTFFGFIDMVDTIDLKNVDAESDQQKIDINI